MAELADSSAHAGRAQVRAVEGRTLVRIKSFARALSRGDLGLAGHAFECRVGWVAGTAPRALCTAPGEWLWVADDACLAALARAAEPELARQQLALVDLSAALAVFEVHGPGVRQLLEHSCGVDCDPARFAADACIRTRFARVAVLIDCRTAGERYDLYVSRSYGAYLINWLQDAAALCG
jgi:heterotetrameric sarcosine oxidase gamma subunit